MSTILTYIHTVDEAENLICYAAELARDMKMSVDILYTAEIQTYPTGIQPSSMPHMEYTHEQVESILADAESEIARQIERVNKKIKNPPQIRYFTKQGISNHVIEEFTSKSKYDFVVLAASPDNDFLINDRNMDIIKLMDRPVWIIPEDATYKQLKSIVYATDYNEEDVETMRKITGFAEKTSAKITALHVNDNLDFEEKVKNKGFTDILIEKVGYRNLEVSSMVQKDNTGLSDTIIDFSKLVHADLIVILKENKGFFEKLFASSNTKMIMNKTEIPVLIFQQKKS